MEIAQEARKLHGLLHRTARMGRHEIRHQELILPARFIHLLIAFGKFLIDFMLRFSHHCKHRIRNVLRGYLELSADMILHQFPEKVSD